MKTLHLLVCTGLLLLPNFLRAGVVVGNQTYYANTDAQAVYSPDTLETSGAVTISPGANVFFGAVQQVRLKPGFHAAAGSKFRAQVGQPSQNSVSPAEAKMRAIPDMEAWVRADSGILLGTEGGVVLWKDQSGQNNNMERDEDSKRDGVHPDISMSTTSFGPYLELRTTDHSLLAKNYFMQGATEGEVFIVLRGGNMEEQFPVGIGEWVSLNYPYFDNGTGQFCMEDGFGGVWQHMTIPDTLPPCNTWRLYNASASSTAWRAWLNDQKIGEFPAYKYNFNRAGPTFSVGSDNTDSPVGLAEIIIFSRALTEQERATVTEYLRSKYSLWGDSSQNPQPSPSGLSLEEWGRLYGFDFNNDKNAALLDDNGDGWSNAAEYNRNSDPKLPTSNTGNENAPPNWNSLVTPDYSKHEAAGATKDSISVAATGAASYSIPFFTVPGTGGMQPAITLAYNSQANGGIAGHGWSLGGFSSITRGPKTFAMDGYVTGVNFDRNDEYYLDGQRLVHTGGSEHSQDGAEYRTDIDQFSRVVAQGAAGEGPASFKVWNKAGWLLEFGSTSVSDRSGAYRRGIAGSQ